MGSKEGQELPRTSVFASITWIPPGSSISRSLTERLNSKNWLNRVTCGLVGHPKPIECHEETCSTPRRIAKIEPEHFEIDTSNAQTTDYGTNNNNNGQWRRDMIKDLQSDQ